jgi:hypothetical protein
MYLHTHAYYIHRDAYYNSVLMVIVPFGVVPTWIAAKKKILKTQKQQPKNAAAKRNDAYIINIIIYYYNIAITRWGRFTHVHLIHHIVERCYDIIYSSIRLSILFSLFFLGTSSRCAVILLINPIHYYTRVVLFGGRHRRVRDGNYTILFILSRKIRRF